MIASSPTTHLAELPNVLASFVDRQHERGIAIRRVGIEIELVVVVEDGQSLRVILGYQEGRRCLHRTSAVHANVGRVGRCRHAQPRQVAKERVA